MEAAKFTEEDLGSIPLGQHLDKDELKRLYKLIFGGVAWPGKKPGFAIIVGMSHRKHFDNYDVYLLEEFETPDTRELVRQCGVLDYKYGPESWTGDRRNDAADRFIKEMNQEFSQEIERASEFQYTDRRLFSLASTQMLKMKQPFAYILPETKRLLDKERRQLFLKDSKITSYLHALTVEQIQDIEFGEFPAIEALAFAVIEMRQFSQYSDDYRDDDDMRLAESYAAKTVL